MIKQHPTLPILCNSENGMILAYNSKKPHWTKGYKRPRYYQYRIDYQWYFVHRLIGETFLDNPSNKPQIDHINRDVFDNRLVNLRWVTALENAQNKELSPQFNVRSQTPDYWRARTECMQSVLLSDGSRRYMNRAIAAVFLSMKRKERWPVEVIRGSRGIVLPKIPNW